MSELFKPGSIVIVVGPGGVGKTTVAAALGMAAALVPLETAVITIDPARRLRDALGMTGAGGRPARLERRWLRAAGLDPGLALSVMALDVKTTWDGLIEHFIADATARREILSNAFYRNLTERYAGAESYAALEMLHDLHEARRFALAIVDTPPATHAFDFIEAPEHLARLLDSKAARWAFTWTAASNHPGFKLGNRAARLVIDQLERVTGARSLAAIAEFFAATAGAADAIAQRMRATAALLRSSAVRFVLVTTAAEDRLDETRKIASQMKAAGLRLGLVVINRLADERTFAALCKGSAGGAPLLREVTALRGVVAADSRRTAGSAALVDYLGDYLAEQIAARTRVARFVRALPGRTVVAMLPEIAGIAGELNSIARLAAILGAACARSESPATPTVAPGEARPRTRSTQRRG